MPLTTGVFGRRKRQEGSASFYDIEAVLRIAVLARAISDLIRCTTLVPVLNSRAVLRMPLPLASAARIAASFVASILARPIGFPLLVPFSRAPGKSGVYPFLDDCALKLCEYAQHLEERPAS